MAAALIDGIRIHGIRSLPFTRGATELQSRICSLHHWYPDTWPDWSDAALLDDLDWLIPYCNTIRTLSGLNKLNLKTILLSRLDWRKQQELETLAPTHLKVPSSSNIRLTYVAGEPPVLAVRLQELFGLQETPSICRGQIPVLLHLLSPARRPLQITTDLASFWKNSYQEIRKELAGRYPKHYWPENPFLAQATSGTKPKFS
jgi:ATP-dependent helicase HrpB